MNAWLPLYFVTGQDILTYVDTEITTSEAAKILGVTPRHMRWYHAQGHLKGRPIGDEFSDRPLLLVFRREDVERFVKPKKTGRPKAARAKQKGSVK